MPTPYLIAVCVFSVLDVETNNFSLFNLVEEVKASSYPQTLPWETHIYWILEDFEIGEEFQVRAVLVRKDGSETFFPIGRYKSVTRRFRLRIRGLELKAPGQYDIMVESRRNDKEEWTRHNVRCPLEVHEPLPAQ